MMEGDEELGLYKEEITDLEKLAFEQRKQLNLKGTIDGFVAGYNKAKETLFTKKDMENAIRYGFIMELEPNESMEAYIEKYIKTCKR
jgi:hypothetical protein